MEQDVRVQLVIGDIVKAKVIRFEKTYIQLSVGSISAIMPLSEYSWNKKANCRRDLNIGTELNAVVIKIEGQTIMLSRKRLNEDPWKNVENKFKPGINVIGKVVRIMSYGAFIEFSDGMQGLLHKNNIIYDNTDELDKILSEGQAINVHVDSIDLEGRRITLSATI